MAEFPKAHLKGLPWPGRARFMLFAPADPGCHLEQLLSQALSGIPFVGGAPAGARLLLRMLPLQDVAPNSNTLVQLKALTEPRIDQNTRGFLLARRVLRARQDTVITNSLAFFADEEAVADYVPLRDPMPGSDIPVGHTAVCKPTERYREPLDHVVRVLLTP